MTLGLVFAEARLFWALHFPPVSTVFQIGTAVAIVVMAVLTLVWARGMSAGAQKRAAVR